MSANEPKWPSTDELISGWRKSSRYSPDTTGAVRAAIEACRAAWLAANDDPSADLPGTVRISLDSSKALRTGMDGMNPWLVIDGEDLLNSWLTNAEVSGWTRGTPVEGTPAAKAAEQ